MSEATVLEDDHGRLTIAEEVSAHSQGMSTGTPEVRIPYHRETAKTGDFATTTAILVLRPRHAAPVEVE